MLLGFSSEKPYRYLAEQVDYTSPESLEEYWNRKRLEFPQLHRIARNIFSVVPSEAICEYAFSRCGYIYDKTRNRLAYPNVELIMLGVLISEYHPDLLMKCL